MNRTPIERWHQIVQTRDLVGLERLLADNVVFESPVVHTPQAGKPITTQYLRAALHVLVNDSFKYLREWHNLNSAVLEFETNCDGILINGVDMITWNTEQQITHFKVMVRPLKAVNKLHELMARLLQESTRSGS
ncbi:MAG: nuclear transport factor 2 family protein [Comamonadaceae bacterium]